MSNVKDRKAGCSRVRLRARSSWFNNAPGGAPPPQQHQPGRQPAQYSSVPSRPHPQQSAQGPPPRRPVPPQYGDQPQRPAAPSSQGSYEKYPTSPRIAPPARPPRGGRFAVVEAPSTGHALTNCLIVNESDWGGVPYVRLSSQKGQFVFTTK